MLNNQALYNRMLARSFQNLAGSMLRHDGLTAGMQMSLQAVYVSIAAVGQLVPGQLGSHVML